MVLDALIKENSYPIIFIGSGISKRYLMNSPSWIELLQSFWDEVGFEDTFYGALNRIKDRLVNNGLLETKARFQANIDIATIIEKEYNDRFNNNLINIDGLTQEEVYEKNISPFKYSLSNKFLGYSTLDGIEEEFESWKRFIRKSQIVITTNYDTLIEDSYADKSNVFLKKYIGQNGFFDKTYGNAELFKIHGCCTDPNSIVINSNDYELFNKNSILISAKILSSLISSPIIFLGYSLTDANVRKIISDFTSQLPNEDTRISANRIIVVERLEGEQSLEPVIVQDLEIGSYTSIKTDNYKAIYDKISSINQGLTPYEVRRYEEVMRKLIISSGEKGTLDAVLLSPKDLSSLEKDIDMNKPIVMAFGDKKHIYVMPDLTSYIKDYIFEENNIMPSVALKFVARESIKSRIPFSRYISQFPELKKLDLTDREEENLKNKINKYMGTLDDTIDTIKNNKIRYTNLYSIWNTSQYSKSKKLDLIIYNIKFFDKNELDTFIKEEAFPLLVEVESDKSSNLKSPLRKLFYAYDLLINGDLKRTK